MADPVTLPPVSHTPADGINETFEPKCNCPTTWGSKVLGFDLGMTPATNPKPDADYPNGNV